VYNLEVEGAHSYFVGHAHVLVHNACKLAVKRYDEWSRDPNKPANTEINHLNQDAVYGTSHGGRIPYGAGAAIPLTGDTKDPCTEHYQYHRSLEDFWDQYRPGGAHEGERPTNREYGEAMQNALIAAGFSPTDAARFAAGARKNRIDYQYYDDDLVPRVPGKFMAPRKPCLNP